MAKIFMAYRFTGEDPKELDYILGNMRTSLEEAGNIVICSFHFEDYFRKQGFTANDIYEYMLKKQEESDTFLALIKSLEKSKGMQMESENALKLGHRYIVASKSGLYLPEFHDNAQEIIAFDTFPQLFEKLKIWQP